MDILAQIIIFFAIIVFIGNALVMVLTSYELKTAIQRRLKVDLITNKKKSSLFMNILNLLIPVNHFLIKKFFKSEKMEERLFAGRVFIMPEQFLAIKEILAFLFLFFTFMLVQSGDIIPVVIFPLVGFMAPDIWLAIKVNQRKAAVIRALPDVVDLLSLCVDAGLDFIASARWIVEKSFANAFTEELSLVLHEIKVGKSRRDALKDMAKRLNLSDVTAFCRTLIQADRMGIPIAEALIVLSDDTRERFFRRAERKALQAPMKMLLPLIFFILPVVGVVVGGPVLLQFMQGGLGGLQ
ncbi:type II secretion system F family protein [Thermoproteota archaeon]